MPGDMPDGGRRHHACARHKAVRHRDVHGAWRTLRQLSRNHLRAQQPTADLLPASVCAIVRGTAATIDRPPCEKEAPSVGHHQRNVLRWTRPAIASLARPARKSRALILLAEPLGSLAFLVQIKMSGRGRGRNIPVNESNPDSNASIVQLLRLLVDQQGRGNGQSSSSRGPSNDDPQERFRRQKPREFSGTIDPFVAESWIKSMEVIFEYLQTPDL
ncbi:hypothetical protein F511_43227 [Dorcoceras hygrometricum]|uniref:Uncharacterized protein n=1 Tax=Dorcoceras hygrometricum TaxID=472368 RepID=A0A2Z7CY83_9LAMI|nr:hypothetical protein F511_43227 [Dorcoceras hygrometricum]